MESLLSGLEHGGYQAINFASSLVDRHTMNCKNEKIDHYEKIESASTAEGEQKFQTTRPDGHRTRYCSSGDHPSYHVTNLTTKQKVNQQKESKASLDEGRARFGYMFQREGRSRLPNASLSHVPLLILVV